MVATVALLAWIVVGAALFALTTPIRAFSLVYVVGMLLLPAESRSGEGVVVITMSLRIDKLTACNIAALLGTLLFTPGLFSRYRFGWLDGAYLAVLASVFCTSLVNGLGPYDGASCAFNEARVWVPLIVLGKVHIGTLGELYQFLRAVVGGAFVYALVAMFEWRMSPQLHTWVWGYFPHAFDQFVRSGMMGLKYEMFRPLGMFRHALELSGFLAMGGGLAAWLWHKRLLTPLWGVIPGGAVVITILLGLLATITLSGYIGCAKIVALLAAMQWRPNRAWLVVLPAAIAVWMAGRYTDVFSARAIQSTVASLDAERGASLEYRLDAEARYLTVARANPVFGLSSTWAMGATGQAIQEGTAPGNDEKKGGLPALDGYWLIQVAFNGLSGLITALVVWTGAIWTVCRRWRSLSGDARTLMLFVAVALGVQMTDFLFNSFPSPFLMIANAATVGLLTRVPARAQRAAAPGVAAPEYSPAVGAR